MEKNENTSKKIEELKNKIYSNKSDLKEKTRRPIQEKKRVVSDKWKDEDVKEVVKKKRPSLLKSSMFRKMFFGALIFFLISIGFGSYMFFGGSNTVSADNIDISVLGNAFANGGEDLPLQIQIANKNSVGLEYADLLIEYQKGAGAGEDIFRNRIGVGDISASSVTKELINVTLFGQQGTTRDINITLEYRVPGSNAIFVKEKIYIVNISSAPVNLIVSGPENTGSNQNISFTIKTSLNTPDVVKNMMVVVDYPRGFDFKSAEPAPTFGDNIWILGDINPGVEREIKVNGILLAQSGEQRAFNVYTGQQKDVNERDLGVQFNSQSYVVSIQKPFVDTRLTLNGSSAPEVFLVSGGLVKGEIAWKNPLSTKVTDVEIVAEISGPIADPSSVTTDGFFESATNKIIWNKQNFPEFADLSPGQSGKLAFTFKTTEPNSNGSEAYVSISIKAREPSESAQYQDIKNFERRTIKIATNMQFEGHALYNSGSFNNTGPIPPKADESTTYTVVWSLVNSLNDVSGAEVRGKLPIYVDWMSKTSPSNESVSFNASTKEVIWNVGTVKKGSGTNLPPKEVQFQVKFNPVTSHIGQTMELVEDVSFKGTDVLSNTAINGKAADIKARLNKDLNYNAQNDKVQ